MVAFAVVSAGEAAAESRLCRELAHDLELLTLSEPPLPATDSEDPAVGRQLDRLLHAERQAEAAGCGFAPDGATAECRFLELSILQMKRNLARLEGSADQAADQEATADERARLEAALAENGCGDEAVVPAEAGPIADEAPVTRIFGGRIEPDPADDPFSLTRILHPDDLVATESRTVRTFCVRTCDGYVFPLSPEASRSDFGRDQATCEAACPGTATELYYRAGPGDDPDLMTSAATGQLYMDLASAGLYRRADYQRPPSCSCTAGAIPRNFQIMTGSPSAGFDLRQSLGTDPASRATSGSMMVIEAPAPARSQAAPQPLKRAPTAAPDPHRKVRVVGPAFFPAPAAAAVPPAPAPTPAR